jgi:hypothetical protein
VRRAATRAAPTDGGERRPIRATRDTGGDGDADADADADEIS